MALHFTVNGQVDKTVRAFYLEKEDCIFVGTELYHTFVLLKSDSLVNLIEFKTTFWANYSTVMRSSFSGKYHILNDTIFITYDYGVSEMQVSRTSTGKNLYLYKPRTVLTFLEYPFKIGKLGKTSIKVLDSKSDDLKEVQVGFYDLFQSRYDTWGERLADGKIFPALK